MKNSWLIWIFIVGVVITIFFAFNQKNDVPFNDIFPENATEPVDIEYEFVSKNRNEEGGMEAKESRELEQLKDDESISSIKSEKAENVIELEDVVKPAQTATIKEGDKSAQQMREEVSDSSFKFTIQVASFQKKERAENLAAELKKKGFEAFILSKDLKDAGIWHRVYVGQYREKKQAQQMLEKIKDEYKESFIISPE